MPVVICTLANGEKMITESGSMVWMSPEMQMETSAGGVGKAFGRMFSGESLFQNTYTSHKDNSIIAFASSFPGDILAIDITPNNPIIAQKSAFLASTSGIDLSVHIHKKIGAGFFGGEGFIMQKISGYGTVFLEVDGSTVVYDLAAGESLVVDTGTLAYADASVSITVQTVKGVKNVLFGGEGLFNTVVTGPGKVVLQTMPASQFASVVAKYVPTSN